MKLRVFPGFPKPYILLLPLVGMGLFVVLYILAAINYPGGSWNFTDHAGFSLRYNYLCDLLDDYAINGEVNSARFFARSALGILCISIILIWFYLPKLFTVKSINLTVMRWSGLLGLIITLFLASGTHDMIVRVVGIFGVIALITSFVELYKANMDKILILGIFCFIIFSINYYIYETGSYIEILPVIQKITFICFIVWFILLDISIYRKIKSQLLKK